MRKCLLIVRMAATFLAGVSGAKAVVVISPTTVGNPRNPGDTRYPNGGVPSFGGVDYTFNISKYEITAGQYAEFLNAVAAADPHGLYNPSMDSDERGCQITQHGNSGNYTYDFSGRPVGAEADWTNRPVNYVSWYDALRFANWLHNGQGSGDTEDGTYDMSLGSAVVRKPGATWALPTEDEWYKSAYYKNDGVTSNYFDYPTGSDSTPSNDLVEPIDPGNNATFVNIFPLDHTLGSPYWRTDVGAHENSDSPYGTFDQGGNVWEWNETLISSFRGLRGGAFDGGGGLGSLRAIARGSGNPTNETFAVGFRVAVVPEPVTMAMLAVGVMVVLNRSRRFSRGFTDRSGNTMIEKCACESTDGSGRPPID